MNISNELRAALRTAGFTFLALFGASVIGWVQDVTEWASTGGTAVFPDVTVLGKAFVAAVGAALVGLVNWAWLWLQGQGVPLPGKRPVYPEVRE